MTPLQHQLFRACDPSQLFDQQIAEAVYRKMYYDRKQLQFTWYDSLEQLFDVTPDTVSRYPRFRPTAKGGPLSQLEYRPLYKCSNYCQQRSVLQATHGGRTGPYSECHDLAQHVLGVLELGRELTDWGKILCDAALHCGHHFTLGSNVYAAPRTLLTPYGHHHYQEQYNAT